MIIFNENPWCHFEIIGTIEISTQAIDCLPISFIKEIWTVWFDEHKIDVIEIKIQRFRLVVP